MRVLLPFELLLLGAVLGSECHAASPVESKLAASESVGSPTTTSVPVGSVSLQADSVISLSKRPIPLEVIKRRSEAKGIYLVKREKAIANIVISLAIGLIYYILVSGYSVHDAQNEAPGDSVFAAYRRAFSNSPVIMSIDLFLMLIPAFLLSSFALAEFKKKRLRKTLRRTRATSSSNKQAPSSPNKQAPSSPTKLAPSSPTKLAPSSPTKLAPSSPTKLAPSSPTKLAPSSPNTLAPSSPSKEAPSSPNKEAPSSPNKHAPSSSSTPATSSSKSASQSL